jgi:hypothetical protein
MLFLIPLEKRDKEFNYESNNFVFAFLFCVLSYIFIFGVNRMELADSYEARISPLYEYSYIIFIFGAKYSNTMFKKVLVVLMALLFVLQDFYYGGRVTSMQIGLVLMTTLLKNTLTFKRTIILFITGIIVLGLVGSYRVNYHLNDDMMIGNTNFFVNDTATYAYGSSLTVLLMSDFIDIKDKLWSFIYFIQYIFFGGWLSEMLFKDTIKEIPESAADYYNNYRGGLFSFYFFFWFGWVGCVLSGILVSKFINFWAKQKKMLGEIIFLSIIVSSPRWYLYTPLAMFRGPLFFVPIVFVCVKLIEYLTTRRSIKE